MRAASRNEARRSPPARSAAATSYAASYVGDDRVGVRVARLRDRGGELVDPVAVDGDAEADLRLDLVALGHRDVAHVVAEPGDAELVRLAPAGRGAGPEPDALSDGRVVDVADDGLPSHAHPRREVAELAVAVGRLGQVHELHVDLGPREIAVELRVEVEERLLQGGQPGDPHLRRRERVHPGDHPDAAVGGIGVPAELQDRVRTDGRRLLHDPDGDRAEPVERQRELRGVVGDLAEVVLSVQRLAAGDEPHLARVEPRELTRTRHGSTGPPTAPQTGARRDVGVRRRGIVHPREGSGVHERSRRSACPAHGSDR